MLLSEGAKALQEDLESSSLKHQKMPAEEADQVRKQCIEAIDKCLKDDSASLVKKHDFVTNLLTLCEEFHQMDTGYRNEKSSDNMEFYGKTGDTGPKPKRKRGAMN